MRKYHWHMIAGTTLAFIGGYLALLVPLWAGVHGAGLGLLIGGAIDWSYETRRERP